MPEVDKEHRVSYTLIPKIGVYDTRRSRGIIGYKVKRLQIAPESRRWRINLAALTPLDEFPFEFYGEIFAAILASDRKLYLPGTPLPEAFTRPEQRRLF